MTKNSKVSLDGYAERIMYLWGRIYEEQTDKFIEQLFRLDSYANSPIVIVANSCGGDARAGMARILDALSMVRSPIWTVVLGRAASAAAVICACGAMRGRRYISPYGQMLLHNLTNHIMGDVEQMDRSLCQSKALESMVIDLVKKRSKMTQKQIRGLLSEEKWLSAKECIHLGFADSIIGSVEELVPR